MKFLRRLFLRLRNWLAPLESASSYSGEQPVSAPRELGGGEVVSRFIYNRNKMRISDSRPKPSAFDPTPHNELSVAHSTGLKDEEIWIIGLHTVGTEPGRTTIHGRADVPVRVLVEQGLRALRDDKPFDRHTSILGWPSSSDPNEVKQLRKQICLELSQHPSVILALPPSPLTLQTSVGLG